jgi:hypothetical protein
MSKENVVTTHDLVEFAVEQKYGKRYRDAQWNSMCDKVSPDGVALTEGPLHYDREGVDEELEDDPESEYLLNISAYMKKHQLKKICIVAGH